MESCSESWVRRTRYDCIYRRSHGLEGESLNYLDVETKQMITYRSARVHHYPQIYIGHRIQEDLADLLIDPMDGTFVNPGEYEAAKKVWAEDKSSRRFLSPLGRRHPALEPNIDPDYIPLYKRTPTCKHCGKKTKDWVSFDTAKDTCVCRECSRGRREEC